MRGLWPSGGLWQDADFLKLWSAQTISQLGSQVTLLALPLVAIVSLDASPFQVAVLPFLAAVPFLLLSLPVGVWIDRLRRKPLMIVADGARAVMLLAIPVAHVAGVLTLELLYAAAFLNGAMAVFFDLAYLSYVPTLVERTRLASANGKLEGSRSAAQVAGPGLAGALIAALGAPLAILVDALSFGLAAALVGRIRHAEPAPEPKAERARMRTQLREGIAYVMRQPYLRVLTLCTATWNLFVAMVMGIFLLYVVRELDVAAGVVGVVFMLGNVGTLVGALVAGRVARAVGIGRAIAAGVCIASLGLLAVPLAPAALPVPVLVGAMFVFTFGAIVFNINQLTLRQAITPRRLLGRMNSVVRFMYWSTSPAGFLLGGAIGSAYGLRTAIWIGVAGSLVAWTPMLFSSLVRLRALPEPAEEPAVTVLEVTPAATG
jgi:MFS family permease